MGEALVTLPDGRKARVTFDSRAQLDAAISDLTKNAPQRIDYRDPSQITQSVGPSNTPQSEFDAGIRRDMAAT